jgi:DNA invertase Pin-like site-specific DNA recombinase
MAASLPRLRCAIYTRKSTEEGLDQAFNTLDAQREACAAYVLSQQHEGWTLVPNFYDDGGFSGGNIERPGLKQLLDDVRAGRVNVVVVYKIDRLTRSLADFAKIVEVLDTASASFVSVTQAFNTTNSMGRLTLNVLLSFAQFEREVITERIRDKVAASKARGMWMGGPLSLGYEVQDRKLVAVPEEAATVREIMERYLACDSVRTLLAELTRDGIVSKRVTKKDGSIRGGVPFRRGALFWLLSNPVYIGKTRHKDKLYEGEHLAIVDQDLFGSVQTKLAAHASCPRPADSAPSGVAHVRQSSRRIVSLLVGMTFDDHRRPMSPCHTSNHGRRYRYYTSNPAKNPSAPALRLPAGELEAACRTTLSSYLTDGSDLRQLGNHLDAVELGSLITRCADLARKVETAPIAEQRDLFHALRVRVAVTPEAASLTFSAEALFASIDLPGPDDYSITLNLPTSQAWFGHEPRLRLDPPSGPTAMRDEKLVHLIARAFAARDQLIALSELELAALPVTTYRHLERIARLAFLDPAIIRAILAGTQPSHLSARTLWRMASLPLLWIQQRQLLRVGAA